MKPRQLLKLKLLFLSLFLTQILCAQTFREVPFPAEYDGVNFNASSIAFSDVDGDNDQDVLIVGGTHSYDQFAKLYTNDGMGNFSEVPETPFEGVWMSSIAFADVDGDDDPDVLISGENGLAEVSTKLYLNDGMGNFSEVSGTPFVDVRWSSIAFADVDGDDDPDVFIHGDDSSREGISKLYLNDGLGNFSEVPETPFEDVSWGLIAFADVDGDDDPDFFITGRNSSFENIPKLYLNDGMGNFSEVPETPFEGIWMSSIAFADVDGDNDSDLLISGSISRGKGTTKLYLNDGQGNFSEMPDTPFPEIIGRSIAFADVDGDTNPDVFISGWTDEPYKQLAKLYRNDGQGNFSEMTGMPFSNFNGSIAFADVDGDTKPDVLVSGWEYNTSVSKWPMPRLYLNKRRPSSIGNPASEFNFEFVVYPNPVTPTILKVDFNLSGNRLVTAKVYDLFGRLLREQTDFTEAGEHTITVDLVGFSAGSYFIQLEDGERKSIAKFMVVKS